LRPLVNFFSLVHSVWIDDSPYNVFYYRLNLFRVKVLVIVCFCHFIIKIIMSSTATLVNYSSWAKIQPKLRELYNGPDDLFLKTATCANCGLVAVEASDCNTCHKLICELCLKMKSSSAMSCKNCNSSLQTVSAIHPVEQAMFERATF